MDRTVRVRLQAVVDQYRQAMKAAAKDTEDLGKKTKVTAEQSRQAAMNLGRGMMIGGGAVVAGFGLAVAASARFEKQMSGVKAVANATSGEMKQLADAALKAGADTAFSASDAAKAEAELAKAGIAVKDILGGALTGALSLAAAGQLDLADAATVSAQAMNVFKLQGKDVGHIADVLAAAANKSAADVKDLGDGLRQGGLVAAQTGLSLEETAGALAAFADSALVGSDAGTSLKTMLQRLTPQSAEAAAKMDELGITAYDAQGQFIGLDKFAGNLRSGLEKLTDQQKSSALATIFGSDAVRAAAILYDQGEQGIRGYVDAVNDQGAAARMAATQMDNLSGDVEALKGSLETALIQSGSGANKVLRGLVQSATDAVNVFNSLPKPVQETAAGLTALAGAATVMGGATLIGIAQVAKLKTNLQTLGVSAATTNKSVRLLSGGMKALGAVGAIVATIGVVDQLAELATKDVKLGQLGEDLVDFAQKGKVAGELSRILGKDLQNLSETIDLANTNKFTGVLEFWDPKSISDVKQARKDLEGLDQALVALLQSGNEQLAAKFFSSISAAAASQGVSVDELNKHFDGYNDALASNRAQQKAASGVTGGLTSKIEDQASAAKKDADELRALSDQIKAMFDPIFAAQDAITKQAQAQRDLNKAVKEHGRNSIEAKEAQQELLRTTVDLDGAVVTLSAGLRDGSVRLEDVNSRLDGYARAGLISTAQARQFKAQLAEVARQAGVLTKGLGTLNAQHPRPRVDVRNLDPSMNSLRAMERALNEIDGRTASARVVLTWIDNLPAGSSARTITQADGGYVTGPGTSTSDSIPARLSNGEYVINAEATAKHRDLLDLINGGGRFATLGGQSTTNNDNRAFIPTVNVVAAPGEPAGPAAQRALREAAYMLGFN